MAVAKKNSTSKRTDDKRVRLYTGESQRANGTYMYRWTDDVGKRHYIYAPTLEKLREEEKLIIVDEHDGIKQENKTLTLNDLFQLWRETKRGIKDNTFQNYIYMYNLIVAPSFGKNRVQQIKKSDVKKFYNKLADGKRMQVATIDNIHNVLHQVFQVAVDDNIIRQNPTDNMLRELKMSREYRVEKRKALTKPQQELFLTYIKNNHKYEHWYPVFFIMLNTGMRVGEIAGLRWADVDFEANVIRVTHTLVYYKKADGKCSYTMNSTKTEAGEREIPMTADVKSAFLAEKEFQKLIGLESKASIDGYTDFVFLNREGNPLNQSSLNNAIHRITRDCNDEIMLTSRKKEPVLLPNFTCHHLRHTFATRLCESGVNIKVIQNILGHCDISTTMNIYVDVTNDLKQKEIEAYRQYISKPEDVENMTREELLEIMRHNTKLEMGFVKP